MSALCLCLAVALWAISGTATVLLAHYYSLEEGDCMTVGDIVKGAAFGSLFGIAVPVGVAVLWSGGTLATKWRKILSKVVYRKPKEQ